jgi:hypothetical protein
MEIKNYSTGNFKGVLTTNYKPQTLNSLIFAPHYEKKTRCHHHFPDRIN